MEVLARAVRGAKRQLERKRSRGIEPREPPQRRPLVLRPHQLPLSSERARACSVLERLRLLAALLAALLGEEHRVDVGEHAAGRDGDAREQLVELLIVAHSKLHVARDDARLLVVASGVAGELEDLGGEVLEHGGEVHGRARADTAGVLALLQVAVHTADGELQTGLLGARDGLAALGLAATGRALACLAGHACLVGLFRATATPFLFKGVKGAQIQFARRAAPSARGPKLNRSAKRAGPRPVF